MVLLIESPCTADRRPCTADRDVGVGTENGIEAEESVILRWAAE